MRPSSPFDFVPTPAARSARPQALANERPDNTAPDFADTLKRTGQTSPDAPAATDSPSNTPPTRAEVTGSNAWSIPFAEKSDTPGEAEPDGDGADAAENALAHTGTDFAADDETGLEKTDSEPPADAKDAPPEVQTRADHPADHLKEAQLAAGDHSDVANVETDVASAGMRDPHSFNVAAVQPLPAAANSNSRSASARGTADELKASLSASAAEAKAANVPLKDAHQTASQTAITFSTSDWLTGDGLTAESGDVFADALMKDAASKGADGASGLVAAPAGPTAPQHTPAQAAVPTHTTHPGLMKPHMAAIAAPEELVDIVSNRVSGGDRPDKITVQLDPPELGRVSIEFKFDSHGLQHVSVVGDTPDAMKRLRLLHFDLVQSLADNGLTPRDMTFSQNTPQRDPHAPPPATGLLAIGEDNISSAPIIAPVAQRPLSVAGDGINLKL